MLTCTRRLAVFACALATVNAHAAPGTVIDWCWDIVIGADATPAERYGAEELQHFLVEATGATLDVRTVVGPQYRHIYVGPSDAMANSRLGFRTDSLGPEEFRARVGKNGIVIAGGRPRGTLYGVYQFAEDYLGARFLTQDHTVVPSLQLPIPRRSVRYSPPFSFRASFYLEENNFPEFAARLRANHYTFDEKLGGAAPQRLIEHSLNRQVPVEKYGASHPEYFALVDGQRLLEAENDPQVCSINPDVADIVTQAVLAELVEHPERTSISVSQNDNDLYCQCPACAAINEREGTPMGAHLTLVNTVAERIAKTHPKVKIGTLAYSYTRKPPKHLRPRGNVEIQLCSFECCGLHAIDDRKCLKNAGFMKDFKRWRAICPSIWIWSYNTNLRMLDLPYPNANSIAPNLRCFARMGARGVFMQGNGRCYAGEMSDLRNYVTSRLLWNPRLDSQTLINEFLDLHYGSSAEPIRNYLRLLYDTAQRAGAHPTCWSTAEDTGLDAAAASRIKSLFDEALALAPDAVIRARVEKASLCAYKALLETAYSVNESNDRAVRTYAPEVAALIPHYVELCRIYGLTRSAEFTPIEEYLADITRKD
ncbi:MAG: DUF4838 domain-containing protein [Candidatus Hydrogenedentes bacterium]|nr:DUF4838 domain-containing protein [Candidatus Hydrogenedentota bacterium]